jgi:hypothetical protein
MKATCLNKCGCQLLLIWLLAHLESQFFWKMNLEPHKCVQSNWHQQGALNLGGTCKHPIGVWCSIWKWQESAEDLSWAISDHSASVNHRLQATSTFSVNKHSTEWWLTLHMHMRGHSKSQCWSSYCMGNCMKAAGPSFPSAECAGLGHNDYFHQDLCVHWFVHHSRGKP